MKNGSRFIVIMGRHLGSSEPIVGTPLRIAQFAAPFRMLLPTCCRASFFHVAAGTEIAVTYSPTTTGNPDPLTVLEPIDTWEI